MEIEKIQSNEICYQHYLYKKKSNRTGRAPLASIFTSSFMNNPHYIHEYMDHEFHRVTDPTYSFAPSRSHSSLIAYAHPDLYIFSNARSHQDFHIPPPASRLSHNPTPHAPLRRPPHSLRRFFRHFPVGLAKQREERSSHH